jgi:hypothetical protein
MQDIKTHDTEMTGTKMQETTPRKSGSGTRSHTSAVAPKAIPSQAKHVKALIHPSHKNEYRKDHANQGPV